MKPRHAKPTTILNTQSPSEPVRATHPHHRCGHSHCPPKTQNEPGADRAQDLQLAGLNFAPWAWSFYQHEPSQILPDGQRLGAGSIQQIRFAISSGWRCYGLIGCASRKSQCSFSPSQVRLTHSNCNALRNALRDASRLRNEL